MLRQSDSVQAGSCTADDVYRALTLQPAAINLREYSGDRNTSDAGTSATTTITAEALRRPQVQLRDQVDVAKRNIASPVWLVDWKTRLLATLAFLNFEFIPGTCKYKRIYFSARRHLPQALRNQYPPFIEVLILAHASINVPEDYRC
jgi:hypothetical protein